MSNVYSQRLVPPTALTATPATLFTVPAGHTYIVMSITLMVSGGATPSIPQLRSNGAAFANAVYRASQAADTTVSLTELRWVFEAGDDLRGVVSLGAGAAVTVFGSGYDLAG